MTYTQFYDTKLSRLGMGAMRLPVVNGAESEIDEAAVSEMIDYAIKHGVNYFDTAWGYHGGNSETVLGKLLSAFPRGDYYLADKFPGYDLSNMSKVERIFEKQLQKCRTDYFDFYLFHNVCEMNIDAYLDPSFGVYEYLLRQQELGRIRRLGFSAHGSLSVIKRFLDAYGSAMEFCQIQLNYLDWSFQRADKKVELLRAHNIPIWVMEPLRGGKLAKLYAEDAETLERLRPGETAAGWSFRFLQSVPGTGVILSGMSSLDQLKENIKIFETDAPLNEQERSALLDIADRMVKKIVLPCTGCRYCVDHCPQGIDIPAMLELYNEHCFTGGGFIAPMALQSIPKEKQPSACRGCHSCEAVCPQQIKISAALADFAARL